MKSINKVILGVALCGSLLATSCDKFLDRQPLSDITPELYFNSASDMAAYLVNYYPTFLINVDGQKLFHNGGWNAGIAGFSDYWTDNLAYGTGPNVYKFFGDGSHWTVSEGRSLYDTYVRVRIANWFLAYVEPKTKEGGVLSDADCLHYLGEGYFLRAMAYYVGLQQFGDLPIIDKVLTDNEEELKALSVRAPRNEVAHFILKDLDTAIGLLKDRASVKGQRINKEAALLLKSRVALFEGTFEKYHKGSGRVPGDSNWPGGTYTGTSIDSEIQFFLGESMSSAKILADAITLTTNTGVIYPATDGVTYGWNAYYEMFSQPSLAAVPEVLLWREYSSELGIGHTVPDRVSAGGNNQGLTYSLVKSFLMKNGLPIYAQESGYKGDKNTKDELYNRDERLQLFCWGDDYTFKDGKSFHNVDILGNLFSADQIRIITGYCPRKYYVYDEIQSQGVENYGQNACPIFRVAEAYLNYIEACYEKTGTIDATAKLYWEALRTRAGVDTDYNKTIQATDLTKETEDWGLYSGANKVDATLYNIRRERRAEFVAENMRLPDLLRWRSYDHLNTVTTYVKGINFWEEYAQKYQTGYGQGTYGVKLIADGTTGANMSQEANSKYVLPYRFTDTNNELKDGMKWHEAYYLYPLGHEDFLYGEKLYQNINWGTEGGTPAIK